MVDARLPRQIDRIVVMGHGADNDRAARYIEVSGKSFSRRGTAVVAMDAPRHGDRPDSGTLLELPGLQRDLLEEWVRDHLRLLDAIEARWPGVSVGFAGFSMGGLFGVPLLAVEPRIRSGAVVIAGSTRVSYPGRVELDESTREVLDATDPAVNAPLVGERPTLVLCAADDEIVPRAAALALHDAFVGPSQIVFLPGTHTEWRRAARWFKTIETFFVQTLG